MSKFCCCGDPKVIDIPSIPLVDLELNASGFTRAHIMISRYKLWTLRLVNLSPYNSLMITLDSYLDNMLLRVGWAHPHPNLSWLQHWLNGKH